MRYVIFIAVLCAALSAEAQQKAPLPTETAVKEAESLVAEVFQDEINAAKTTSLKATLAGKFLLQAKKSKDDLTSYYVLLMYAKDQGADSGEVQVTSEAIKLIEDTFNIKTLPLWTKALSELTNKAHSKDQQNLITEKALSLIEVAKHSDDFESIKKLGLVALMSARKAKNIALIRKIVVYRKELDKLEKEFNVVKTALATLETKPADAEANLVVGKYNCFVKQDFGCGITMLALGDDPVLRDLAEAELEDLTTTAAQIKMGDLWWAFAETQSESIRGSAQLRAGNWYQTALPNITGLQKAKIAKRLTAINVAEVKVVAVTQLAVAVPAAIADPIIGRWGGPLKRVLKFTADGKVTYTYKGKSTTDTWARIGKGHIEITGRAGNKTKVVPISMNSIRIETVIASGPRPYTYTRIKNTAVTASTGSKEATRRAEN